MASALALTLALTLPACNRRPDKGAVVVSAIGESPALRDASGGPLPEPDRILAGATAQGLVFRHPRAPTEVRRRHLHNRGSGCTTHRSR